MIAITLDTDWAPVPLLAYTTDLLDSYGVRATIFCTDKREQDIRGHELAIHPNFQSRKTEEATLKKLLKLYPNAKGTRSHSLYFHTRLTDLYKKLGIEYDSNICVPARVKPWWLLNDTVEIPVNYLDYHMLNQEKWFPLDALDCTRNPKVFGFHPIHTFLNTDTPERYEDAKRYYQDPKTLERHRNTEDFGTKDYLISLLELIQKMNLETCTLGEINTRFREGKL